MGEGPSKEQRTKSKRVKSEKQLESCFLPPPENPSSASLLLSGTQKHWKQKLRGALVLHWPYIVDVTALSCSPKYQLSEMSGQLQSLRTSQSQSLTKFNSDPHHDHDHGSICSHWRIQNVKTIKLVLSGSRFTFFGFYSWILKVFERLTDLSNSMKL